MILDQAFKGTTRRELLTKITDGLEPDDIQRVGRFIIKGDV